jgi:hypothetical protein
MAALERVYDWAMRQETTPLYLSEYAAKVTSFQRISMARRIDDGAWEIADAGDLQTLRVDPGWGWPDLARSMGVAGVRDVLQGRYVTLAPEGGRCLLYATTDPPTQVHLESANGRILRWESQGQDGRGVHDVQLRVQGHMPLSIVIAGARSACTLRTVQGVTVGVRHGLTTRFSLAEGDTGEATLACR